LRSESFLEAEDMDYSTQDHIVYDFIHSSSFVFRNLFRCLWIWAYMSSLDPLRTSKTQVVSRLVEHTGLSKRWIERYIKELTIGGFVFDTYVNDLIQIVPSATFSILFELWEKHRNIFHQLSSKTSFYALFLLWQAHAYPDHAISDLREASQVFEGSYKLVSKPTFQRSLRLLQQLRLVKKSKLRGPIVPTKIGERIVRSLLLALTTMYGEHTRIIHEYEIGWNTVNN
jgi:hypothetical protein